MGSHWLLALYFEHTISNPGIIIQVGHYNAPSYRGCPHLQVLDPNVPLLVWSSYNSTCLRDWWLSNALGPNFTSFSTNCNHSYPKNHMSHGLHHWGGGWEPFSRFPGTHFQADMLSHRLLLPRTRPQKVVQRCLLCVQSPSTFCPNFQPSLLTLNLLTACANLGIQPSGPKYRRLGPGR